MSPKRDAFELISKVVDVLGGEVNFVLRRTELLEDEEGFRELHERYGLKYKISRGYTHSYGRLNKERFLEFLREFDAKFDLNTCVIDLGGVTINPSLL